MEGEEIKELPPRFIEFPFYFNFQISSVICPVKPDLGIIPSGQENHSKTEHLNFPGRELTEVEKTRR